MLTIIKGYDKTNKIIKNNVIAITGVIGVILIVSLLETVIFAIEVNVGAGLSANLSVERMFVRCREKDDAFRGVI